VGDVTTLWLRGLGVLHALRGGRTSIPLRRTFLPTRSAHQIWHASIAFWTKQNILLRDMVYVQRVPLMRLTIFTFAVLVATIPALAHSWYPLVCCGNMDCFPVACDQLVETVSGWLYVPTGNLFKREQVQPSQDLH